MTRAQSVYFFAIALCSTDSPSSSTAFGSAPAKSNSYDNLDICERVRLSGQVKILNKTTIKSFT